jgi:hypothetical protein
LVDEHFLGRIQRTRLYFYTSFSAFRKRPVDFVDRFHAGGIFALLDAVDGFGPDAGVAGGFDFVLQGDALVVTHKSFEEEHEKIFDDVSFSWPRRSRLWIEGKISFPFSLHPLRGCNWWIQGQFSSISQFSPPSRGLNEKEYFRWLSFPRRKRLG